MFPPATHFDTCEGDFRITGVVGTLRFARRFVSCKEAPDLKRRRNKACRKAVKTALRTGESKSLARFRPATAWDLY